MTVAVAVTVAVVVAVAVAVAVAALGGENTLRSKGKRRARAADPLWIPLTNTKL